MTENPGGRTFDAAETARLLPYPALADSIRDVALESGAGGLSAPARLAVPLPGSSGGVLLVMPAADTELAVTKLVTVHPGNAAHGLPTIQGEMVVLDAKTGRKLGSLDGATVTARRTAALSLLAVRELAARPGGPLLVVGAGSQGFSHLEAFREGLGTVEVRVVSRTKRSAERLAEHATRLGMQARVVSDAAEGMPGADVIVTATTSGEPVLPDAPGGPGDGPDGAFICAVGSFEPEAREIPAGLVAGSTVVVDTLEGAKDEAGDLIQAVASGDFAWEDATTLEDALNDPGTLAGNILFESVGCALWDLAAARVAFSSLNRRGDGL